MQHNSSSFTIPTKPLLTIKKLQLISISPQPPSLSFSQTTSISILPVPPIPPKLSLSKPTVVNFLPLSNKPDVPDYLPQLRNMKFVLTEIDRVNDLVDYRTEQIQILSCIISQLEQLDPP